MSSIHGHEVLQMMIASGESYSVASLEAAIKRQFGEDARFHTCSAQDLDAAQLVTFCSRKVNSLRWKRVSIPARVKFAVIKRGGGGRRCGN